MRGREIPLNSSKYTFAVRDPFNRTKRNVAKSPGEEVIKPQVNNICRIVRQWYAVCNE